MFHENYGQSQHNVAESQIDFMSGIHGIKSWMYSIILNFSFLICRMSN